MSSRTIEYALIAAGISLAIIAAVNGFGDRPQKRGGAAPMTVGHAQDKLGWLDAAEFTDEMRARIARVTGAAYTSNEAVVRPYLRRDTIITARDFELLRQDRRRARAAYPDVLADDLFVDGWLSVRLDERVPQDFCTGGNFNSSTMPDGRDYLDGGCLVAWVSGRYSKRATPAEVVAYFAAKKEKETAAELAELEASGPYAMMFGTGGSLTVTLDKATGRVIVTTADEGSTSATRWSIPFVAREWVGVDPYELEQIKAVPSFAAATFVTVEVPAARVLMCDRLGNDCHPQTDAGALIAPGGTKTFNLQLGR